jgi:predicted deacetylase
MRPHLVVSLSGIGASTLGRCADLAEEFDRRQVPLSLLLAPRAAVDGPALDWVRSRTAGGDSLVLHGFDHTTRPVGLRRRAEFSALPAHEAGLRLVAARAALERLDLTTDLFAPPRWLASPGTLTALRRHRFGLCADLAAIRDLRTGAVHTGRVHGLGRVLGERIESWHCLALVLGASRTARRGGLVRISVDARELDRIGPRQAVLDAVDIALHHDAVPSGYTSFATAVPRAA